MSRKATTQVSHADVAAAMTRFLKRGGIIKHLPEQKALLAGTVGAEKYEVFESLSDLPVVADAGDRLT